MRIVFLGSGDFALPTLETLERLSPRYPLAGVVSRPDRPARRGRKLRPTPVKKRAAELGIESLCPESVNDGAFLAELKSLAGDLFIVADYGEILRSPILELPPLGSFNLHASLLPKYRGAAPVAHALLRGESVTGVTLFRMDEGLDSGPLVATAELSIEPGETAGELEGRLSLLAAELLEASVEAFETGGHTETPQDDTLVTMAPKLRKDAGRIDWNVEPRLLYNSVRAFNPWPSAYSYLKRAGEEANGRLERTSFLRVEPEDVDRAGAEPGTVVQVTKDAFEVACREGGVRVLEIQREGGKAMSAAAYLCGQRLRPGDRFVSHPGPR